MNALKARREERKERGRYTTLTKSVEFLLTALGIEQKRKKNRKRKQQGKTVKMKIMK